MSGMDLPDMRYPVTPASLQEAADTIRRIGGGITNPDRIGDALDKVTLPFVDLYVQAADELRVMEGRSQ